MSIREHGGAVRYWRHVHSGQRAVLCQDGVVLLLQGGRWRFIADHVPPLNASAIWQPDTRPSLSAAITRTNREARRGT